MKVFGIGFHKTGTSTLDTVLSKLGYKVLGTRINLVSYLKEGNVDFVINKISNYDAVQDNPWPLLFKELDKRFPNSKFILTIRDDEKWLKSVVKHFGSTDTEMRSYIYGVGHPIGNEEIYLKRYQKHNSDVINYFKDRPEDLLIVNWEESSGWKEICDFLNKPIPSEDIPHSNKGTTEKNRKWVKLKNIILRRIRF